MSCHRVAAAAAWRVAAVVAGADKVQKKGETTV